MKVRHLLLAGVLLGLGACGGTQTVTETMTIHGVDASKTLEVLQGSEHVIVRRLAAADIRNVTAKAVPLTATTATLSITVPDNTAADKTRQILAEPFTFDLRIEKPATGSGESDWTATAVTGDTLDWVQVIGEKQTGHIGIELQFNSVGQAALASVFKDNVGKNVGIFVRDLLVSKLKINNSAVADRIVISGIPSATVAGIFADDVNVGLHVLFTPVR